MPEETRIVIKGGRTEDTVISSFPGAAQAAPWGGLVPLRFFLYAPVEKKQKWANGTLFCDEENDICLPNNGTIQIRANVTLFTAQTNRQL